MRSESRTVGAGAAIGFLTTSLLYGGLVLWALSGSGSGAEHSDNYMGLSHLGAFAGFPWAYLWQDGVSFVFLAFSVGINGAILGTVLGLAFYAWSTRA